MEKVRIGIVGIGNMGSAHAVSVYAGRIEGLTLAAVCDIDEAKCRWAAQHLPGVPCYTDYEDMLAEAKLDAVLIAAPHYAHPPMAEAAFARGLHVLTEKPLGVSARRARAVLEAAKAAGTVFGIMYNQRTNPLFARAKELLQAGRLGRRKRLVWIITNWYRTQAYYDSGSWRASWAGEGGGVLINQCPHNLDLWQWIYGMPTRIRADCGYGRYHHIEVEDDVTAYAEYEDGGTATFIATTGECPGTNRLEMSGDRGKIVIEDGVLKFWELEQPQPVSAHQNIPTPNTSRTAKVRHTTVFYRISPARFCTANRCSRRVKKGSMACAFPTPFTCPAGQAAVLCQCLRTERRLTTFCRSASMLPAGSRRLFPA